MQLTEAVEGRRRFEEFSEPWLSLNLGSALFRKTAFDKVGFFDEKLFYSDDMDWFMRARERGISMVIHKDVTHLYRRHERNITNRRDLDNSYTIKMLKKSLDRRREQNNGIAQILPKLDCIANSLKKSNKTNCD